MTDEAAHDPKYSTFIKRLVSFKWRKTKGQKAETDKQFCDRLGISLSKYRNWLYRGVEPDIPSLLHLSEFLDVSPDWLYSGKGMEIEYRPDEGLRVVRIPREPLEIIEEIGVEGMVKQKAKTS